MPFVFSADAMKNGNWIPISKALVKFLPKDRPYSKLEAATSMQMDYDQHNDVTIAGYADLWRWSRRKVSSFIADMGAGIEYPENTGKRRNQRGHIVIHKPDINRTYNAHIRMIDSKGLESDEHIKSTLNGHKPDIRRSTTRDPNPKPDPKETPPTPPRGNSVPCGDILKSYHDHCPTLHPCELTPELTKTIRARWNSRKKMQTVEWWDWYFDGVSGCDFLMGKKKDWAATFTWLIGPKNMTKVLGGDYVNRDRTDRAIEDWINGPD